MRWSGGLDIDVLTYIPILFMNNEFVRKYFNEKRNLLYKSGYFINVSDYDLNRPTIKDSIYIITSVNTMNNRDYLLEQEFKNSPNYVNTEYRYLEEGFVKIHRFNRPDKYKSDCVHIQWGEYSRIYHHTKDAILTYWDCLRYCAGEPTTLYMVLYARESWTLTQRANYHNYLTKKKNGQVIDKPLNNIPIESTWDSGIEYPDQDDDLG